MLLDSGVTIPLWFMGASFVPRPKLVVACVGPGVSWPQCVACGQALRAATEQLGRHIALITSVDLSHAQDKDNAQYGFDPAGAECGTTVVEAVRTNDLGACCASIKIG